MKKHWTLVPGAYQSAVEETGIEPIDQPKIDLVQMEKGKPFIFKAVVEVKPEVTLGEYRGVEVTTGSERDY
jgi:trigger factor